MGGGTGEGEVGRCKSTLAWKMKEFVGGMAVVGEVRLGVVVGERIKATCVDSSHVRATTSGMGADSLRIIYYIIKNKTD